MAVANSDSRFDWCNELYRLRANYSNAECCNKIKAYFKTLKGADKGFMSDVPIRDNSTFSYKKCYVPVYTASITATFSWDVEETKDKGDYTVTTTTHNTERKNFTAQAPIKLSGALAIDSYTGRSDERFFRLSHVDDLDGGIYPGAYVQTKSSMRAEVDNAANKNKSTRNSEIYINGWSCEATFVPIMIVSYEYAGVVYSCSVNMHNGSFVVDYPVSAEGEKAAKIAHGVSILMKLVSTGLFVASVFIFPAKATFLTVLWVIIKIGLTLGMLAVDFNFFGKQHFLNLYGEEGKLGIKAYLSQIVILIFAIIVFAVSF